MKLKDWLSEWLENYVKPSSKPKTYARYNEIVHKQLSGIDNCELNDLTEAIVKKRI